jgi:peroxiredoxin
LIGADRFADPGLPFAPIHTLPTTFVISREGRVLARWEGIMPRAALDEVAGLALNAK